MAFELFDDYGAASRNTVTLRASGYLFIPDMFRKKSIFPQAECVKIYVDKENTKIGIEFTDELEGSGDGVKKLSLEKSGVAVNILPILRYLDISKQKTKQILSTTKENNLLVINIYELLSNEGDIAE